MRNKILAVLWWCLTAGSTFADVFDPQSNVLSIPSLQIGVSTYENARLLLSPNGQWNLLSLGSPKATTDSSSTGTTVSALTLAPATINVYAGEDVGVVAVGGVPPFQFNSSRSSVSLVSQSGRSATFAAYGVGTTQIIVTDSAGNQASSSVTVTSGLQMAQTTISGVVGEQLTIYFGNGVPPYTVGTSNSSIAKTGEVTYHAGLTASATVYTFRAGTATVTVHDAYGNVASTALTVTNTR